MFDEQSINKGSFLRGLLIAAGVNLAALVAGIILMAVGIGALIIIGFGALQVLWLLPFWLKFWRKGESQTCLGILLGGGLTLLLSVACWSNLNLGNMH